MIEYFTGLYSEYTAVFAFILFAVGLVLIIFGGDWFVDAATWVARISGIPQFVIGATIVSVATTLPEIMASTIATAQGEFEIAAGNAIGSVTANTGMILAISIIFLPSVIKRKKFTPKGIIFLAAIILLHLVSITGILGVWGAVAMLIVFALFIWENIRDARSDMTPDSNAPEKEKASGKSVTVNITKFVLGAAGIVAGASLLVDNGQTIATDVFHIDPRIVALTMVAIGTSLPELVTTITAIVKKQSSLSVGNIVGANIIDMTLILPLCSFISGGKLIIKPGTLWVDLPVCLAVAAIAIVPTIISKKFRRWQGVAMLVVYASYIVYICALAP